MSEKIVRRDFYLCWAIVRPADDVPGTWVAHCLEFDVVTQGSSIKEAIEMVREATSIVVADDGARGFDPTQRHAAPPEHWVEFRRIQDEGQKVDDLDTFLARREALAESVPLILAVPFAVFMDHVRPIAKTSRLPSFATDQVAC